MDFLNAIIALSNFVIIPAVAYGSQLALGALGVTLIYGDGQGIAGRSRSAQVVFGGVRMHRVLPLLLTLCMPSTSAAFDGPFSIADFWDCRISEFCSANGACKTMNKKTRVLSTVLVEPSATKVHNVRWLQIHKPGDWYPVEFWNGTEFHLNKWLADELEFHYDNKDYALIVNQWLPEGERRAEMTLLHKSGVPTKVNKTKLECEF